MYFDLYGGIHASMKSTTYETCVAFSCSQLLACACNCLSGSKANNQHTCVHSLAKLYQLCILYNGLARSVLIELQVWLCKSEFSLEQEKMLLKAVKQLAFTAGVQVNQSKNTRVFGNFCNINRSCKVATGENQDCKLLAYYIIPNLYCQSKKLQERLKMKTLFLHIARNLSGVDSLMLETNPNHKPLSNMYYAIWLLCSTIKLFWKQTTAMNYGLPWIQLACMCCNYRATNMLLQIQLIT